MIESAMDSCFFKSFMACVLGYGLGAAIGLFSSSVNPNIADPLATAKQQTAREIFREMRTATHSYGKNFAMIGMVFSAVECTIESSRGRADWRNGTYAGAVTGGLIGLRGKEFCLRSLNDLLMDSCFSSPRSWCKGWSCGCFRICRLLNGHRLLHAQPVERSSVVV